MAVTPQHATATADGSGDAVFTFPDVPSGEIWCGTTTIPGAPASATGMVYASGELLGSMAGSGSFGPWIASETRRLALVVNGLTPAKQYQAVWHADDKGLATTTYPAPITPTVVSGGGTVTIANFPAVQTVDGTVGVNNFPGPPQAPAVESGQVSVSGTATALPSHTPTVGVTISAPASNAHPIYVGGPAVSSGTGMILSPGQAPTPILPVANSNLISVVGTAGDVASFLVL